MVDGTVYEGCWDDARDGWFVVATVVVPVFHRCVDGSWEIRRERSRIVVGLFDSEEHFNAMLKAYRESPDLGRNEGLQDVAVTSGGSR